MVGSMRNWLTLPLQAAGLLGSQKSFRNNRLIGDPELNRKGLHRRRVELAAAMAARRRAALAGAVSPEDRAAFDRDGFVMIPDAMPPEAFARLVDRLRSTPFEAREMRQGQTVTRMIPLGPAAWPALPEARDVARSARFDALLRYAAATNAPPVWFVQTVIAEPDRRTPDPQTELHADTFHATAKLWLFLQDVGEDDGPFMFVPGSHRLTRERLEWEYRCSLTARDDPRSHHAHGSFRVRPDELAAMGFPEPRKVVVRANTLVVADTFGFHARTPSPKPTLRMELHAHLRQGPFGPFALPGWRSLPGIAERQLELYLALADFNHRRRGKGQTWKPVGPVTATSPAHV